MAIPNKIVIDSVIVGDSVGFIDLRSHLCNSGKLACCERLVIILLADFYGGRIDKTLNLKSTNFQFDQAERSSSIHALPGLSEKK